MKKISRSALLTTVTTVLLAQLSLPAMAEKSEPIPELHYEGSNAPVTLSNGSGDGSLTITVDGYGSFGSSTPAGDAIYDPIGGLAASGTVYESGVFFSGLGDFLTTDSFGAGLPPVDFTAVGSDFAQSTFDLSGFHFDLTQRLNPIGAGGTSFIQSYVITNNSGQTQDVLLVRHVDGDLLFDGTLADMGGVSGNVLFEFDEGDDPQTASTFVGISGNGGTAAGYTMQPFRFSDDIQVAGGIPPSLIGEVFNDANGDGVTDSPYDVTLSQQHELTIPAGGTLTYSTTTIFGSGSTADIALQVLDPACSQATSCQGDYLGETNAGVFPINNVEQLIAADVIRSGTVADGVTQLLLRVDSSLPVTFTLEPQATNEGGDTCQWGTLLQRDGSGSSCSSIQVDPEPTSDGLRVFAVYRAPINFPLTGNESIAELRIAATSGSTSANADLEIRRPPVVLVHGVWSGPNAWRNPDGGLRQFLLNAGFTVALVDHGDIAGGAGSFDPSAESAVIHRLITTTEQALRSARLQNVAATQVDVVSHSMGGLITRARSVYSRAPYRRPANYLGGDFHKLITIGTPHRGTPLVDFFLEHRCDQLSELWFDPTLESFFETIGKPLGPAIYGFQTASRAIHNIGAGSAIPSRAIVGAAPANSDTENHLNRFFGWSCNDTNIDEQLGANHDTLVPETSQRGGLPPGAVGTEAGVVHAAIEFDAGPDEDTGETESAAIWNRVITALRGSLEDLEFGSFSALGPIGDPILPGNCQPIDRCDTELLTPTLRQPEGSAIVTILPQPGSTFAPGDEVIIELTVDGGNPVDGALFIVDGSLHVVEGGSPFQSIFSAPTTSAGRIDVRVATFGGEPQNYGAETHLLVIPTEPPQSLMATPSSLEVSQGDSFPLRIDATFSNGAVIDVTLGNAGTSYSTLSGGEEVISVSADGLVTGTGVGSDTVLIESSGVSTAAQVTVRSQQFLFFDGFESGDPARWSSSAGFAGWSSVGRPSVHP